MSRRWEDWPCHKKPLQKDWCDHLGPGDFMGHVCVPPKKPSLFGLLLCRLGFHTPGQLFCKRCFKDNPKRQAAIKAERQSARKVGGGK